MTRLLLRVAVAAVRAWTRAYTFRLPPSVRDARRSEVESDLWESGADRGAALPLQMLARLVFGVFDDLAWRGENVTGASRGARTASVVAASAAVAVVCVWVAMRLVPVSHPQPPAPPEVRWPAKQFRPPPPPPPPPCYPTGIARKPFSPCTPY